MAHGDTNPELDALFANQSEGDFPSEAEALPPPASKVWPTTQQGWREYYRDIKNVKYAKAGYLQYSRSYQQGKAARERAAHLSGQMAPEQYEALFTPEEEENQPEAPASLSDPEEYAGADTFRQKKAPASLSDPEEYAGADTFRQKKAPAALSDPEEYAGPDTFRQKKAPAGYQPSIPPAPPADLPQEEVVDSFRDMPGLKIHGQKQRRGSGGGSGNGTVKAPPIASQVPPPPPGPPEEPPDVGAGMAAGALGGAAAGLKGGVLSGVGAGAVGGFLAGGPMGAAAGAGAGLLGGLVHDMKTPGSGISDFTLGPGGRGSEGGGSHAQAVLSALNKIAGTRSRL